MAKKSICPFFPGRPAPAERFVGRPAELERLRRKIEAALTGRLEVGFVIGERGIGKSSLAACARTLCGGEMPVLGLHVFLGGITTPEEAVQRIFEQFAIESSGAGWADKLSGFFGEHVAENRNRHTDGRLAVARLVGGEDHSHAAHLALLELGASHCASGTPSCGGCPLADSCAYAIARGFQLELPTSR